MDIKILNANYNDEQQAKDITFLLNAYALDPMGGKQALDKYVMDNLAAELSKLPHAFSVIAYVDNKPAGLINCFDAFSTFTCKPLVNIHDVTVLEEYRGNGICQMMLQQVENIAASKDCCKITLEVLSKNDIAKSSYTRFGFSSYALDPEAGHALFWQKKTNNSS